LAALRVITSEPCGIIVSPYAEDVLINDEFTVSLLPSKVDLVNVSSGELGLTDCCDYSEICTRALASGLHLCPAEVGPRLRLHHRDMGMRECLGIGMEAFRGSKRIPWIFLLLGKTDLDVEGGRPETVWRLNDRLVFVRPR
jgi:hypothetical protein